MRERDLRPGDPWPYPPTDDGITGEPCPPVWHVLVSRPGQEAKLRDWLEERGVTGWYPEIDRTRRKPSAPGGVVTYQGPVVSGYVLARFSGAPRWHVILGCSHVARYVTQDEQPVAIPDADVARMAQVPEVLASLKREVEARDAAERAARLPVAGQPARIEAGPLIGIVAVPARVAGEWVRFEIGSLQVDVPARHVRRLSGIRHSVDADAALR